ncbi:MAG: cyclase family protein, partial [Dehalococcoidia bacterium]
MTIDASNTTRDDVLSYLRDRRNWGRWGDDDQRGAINLITPEKRVRAAQLVRSGRSVSISRDLPKRPGRHNPWPAQHFLQVHENAVTDFYGINYHGHVTTHVDALCHVWDSDGMWGGRKPAESFDTFLGGALWGGIEHWRDGITTRGVLLDVPKFRGTPYVTVEEPVHGAELEAIARAQDVALEPGDA